MRYSVALFFLASACSSETGSMMMTEPFPENALEVTIGPLDVPSGSEVVMCEVVKLPTDGDVDIVRLESTLAAGSHHLVLYRSDATAPSPPRRCTSFDGVFRGEAPIFIAESARSEMKLPTGVAYHFKAGQYVRLEAHYLNATGAPIKGKGTFRLVAGEKNKTYIPADIMMCGSVASLACELGGGVQPGEARYTLPVGFYNGRGNNARGPDIDYDLTQLKVFAFTSHQHQRGIEVKVWKSSNSSPQGTPLYTNESWDNPPLQTYGDGSLLTFAPGEGFAWQCSYDTRGDTQPICFGESAADEEMCFIWAYYFPSVGRFIAQDDCWIN